jgi:hypothetical protein
MANRNVLTVGYKETKDVLMLIIGLGHAYEQMKADGKINLADLVHLLPIMFLVGPAIEGFDNVQLELKMANKEEGEELKAWVNDQLDLQDKTVEEFVEASFAVILDIWMVFRTFFFPGEENLLKVSKDPTQPEAPKSNDAPDGVSTVNEVSGEIVEENMNGVPVDLVTPTAE